MAKIRLTYVAHGQFQHSWDKRKHAHERRF